MYVEKILRNQKRIERTIQLYEENQKKEQASSSVAAETSEKETVPQIQQQIVEVDTEKISEAEAVA